MTATTSPTLRTEGEIAIPARGLSIRQPWAWAIARGWKPVENRSRAFPLALTGIPIAVHASVRRDETVFTDLAAAIFTDAATQVLPDPEATGALIEALRTATRWLMPTGRLSPWRPSPAHTASSAP